MSIAIWGGLHDMTDRMSASYQEDRQTHGPILHDCYVMQPAGQGVTQTCTSR
jgi:hypothetical protein